MIKQFNGYDDAKKKAQYPGSTKLPAGVYVCKILGTKLEGNMLKVQFDVAEGEYKDFFQNQYKNSKDEDKKYKGMTTLWLPKDDGSEQDAKTKTNFARWTTSIEESNKGYVWDWDETKWKGKLVGICYGEVGKLIDGKSVKFNEARWPVSVESVRSGKAKVPEFYAYKGYSDKPTTTTPASTDFVNVPAGIEEEIPF